MFPACFLFLISFVFTQHVLPYIVRVFGKTQYFSSSIICFLPLLLSTHFGVHQAIEEDKFPEFTVEGYNQSKKTTYAAWRPRLGRSMGPTRVTGHQCAFNVRLL